MLNKLNVFFIAYFFLCGIIKFLFLHLHYSPECWHLHNLQCFRYLRASTCGVSEQQFLLWDFDILFVSSCSLFDNFFISVLNKHTLFRRLSVQLATLQVVPVGMAIVSRDAVDA